MPLFGQPLFEIGASCPISIPPIASLSPLALLNSEWAEASLSSSLFTTSHTMFIVSDFKNASDCQLRCSGMECRQSQTKNNRKWNGYTPIFSINNSVTREGTNARGGNLCEAPVYTNGPPIPWVPRENGPAREGENIGERM